VTEETNGKAGRPPGDFWGHVLNLLGGAGLAMVVNLGAYPLLTRLYVPEDFGLLALLSSFAGPLSVVMCLGYEPALMLPESRSQARQLLSLLLYIASVQLFGLLLLFFCFREPLSGFMNLPQAALWVWWIPVAALFLAANRIYEFWVSRLRRFSLTSSARVVGSFAGIAAKLGWVVALGGGAPGLLAGFLLCEAGKVTTVLIRLGRSGFPVWVPWPSVKELLNTYRNLPRFHLPYTLLLSLMPFLPFVVFAACFGPRQVGFFSLGWRMVAVPMELAVLSVSQVFYRQSVSEVQGQGNLASLTERTAARLIVVGLLPFSMLILTGNRLFELLFGTAWADAGMYAQILAPALFVQFVNVPLILFNTLGKQKQGLIWQIELIALVGCVLALAAYVGSPRMAVYLVSLGLTVSYVRLARLNFRLCGASWRRVFVEVRQEFRRLVILRKRR